MPFTEKAKLTALAIVHIFETAKPLGDYSALVVLPDGAGVSYGINQFTHRAGSLYAVVSSYLASGGEVGADVMRDALATLKSTSVSAIRMLSGDSEFKASLKEAGRTPQMKAAQQKVMEEMYLGPAVAACEGSHFEFPLSLAVIYDSINHGGFKLIRDRVAISRSFFPSNEAFEKAWIKEYVRNRDQWLENHSKKILRNTDYRTDFFIAQIGRGNWNLDLPVKVNLGSGFVTLTDKIFKDSAVPAVDRSTQDEPQPSDDPSVLTPTHRPPNQTDAAEIVETKTTEAVQTAGTTSVVETTTPAGDAPDVPPTQVSTNGPLAKWLFAGGSGLATLGSFIWAYIQSNPSAVAIGIICVTLLIVAIIFRGAITDAIRMQSAADPDKKNVT